MSYKGVAVHAEHAFGHHKHRLVSSVILEKHFLKVMQIQVTVAFESGRSPAKGLRDGMVNQLVRQNQIVFAGQMLQNRLVGDESAIEQHPRRFSLPAQQLLDQGFMTGLVSG